MKLKIQELKNLEKYFTNVNYDIEKLRKDSLVDPKWLAFGSGNIFRGYIARINQDMLNDGIYDRGISVVESFDDEIIEKIYKPFNNLAISVTLDKDGNFKEDLIANLVEAIVLQNDKQRIEEIALNKNLQIISFTITEKGYVINKSDGDFIDSVKNDIENDIAEAKHLMSYVTYLLYLRYKDSNSPITLLSLDNCSKNGDKLKVAVSSIAKEWNKRGKVEDEFITYIEDKVSYPWSMIDKITPRPAEEIEKYLQSKSFENMDIVVTSKQTYIAPFVNSEESEYLVIEDDFKNGRPSFEKVGVYMSDRETVNKVETMKVTTCLNPLHTTLAVYGCILGYTSISDEMKDEQLRKLIEKIGYEEALPVVVDPKILDPKAFIDEVINERFPNKYIPDTPQRIATDTSQKIPIRFGETIKKYVEDTTKSVADLKYIPLAIAGWLRYLIGQDDNGNEFELSPDPMMEVLKDSVEDLCIGNFEKTDKLINLLKDKMVFGVDLVDLNMDIIILKYLEEMLVEKGAVRETLKKYL